jgi:hypothetical protein
MNDKDFDKIFGDRLREERRFREDQSDWQRLLARLDEVLGGDTSASVGTSKGFRRWILPLIALLLLLTTGVLFEKLSSLDKANTAMMADIQTLKTQVVKTQDTIFVTTTDTVFIERNSLNQPENNTFIKAKTPQRDGGETGKHTQIGGTQNSNNSILKQSKKSTLESPNNSEFTSNYANAAQGNSPNEQALKNKIIELENKLQVSENQQFALREELRTLTEKTSKISSESLINPPYLTTNLTNSVNAQNDSLNQIIASKDALIAQLSAKKTLDSAKLKAESKEVPLPKENRDKLLSINAQNTIKTAKKPATSRLFVGVSGGQIYYKSTWKSAANNIDIYRNEKSYQVGLKLEYALTDRLRLTAGGDYCPFDFKIFWQDSRYNLPAPQHFYPAVDKLKSSKATQKLTQGFVGTKYMFTDGTNRWRPYIGAAYTAMKILPFEAEFEVQNTATSVIRTLKASSTGTTIANLLLLDGGLEYRFNRRFVAQGEAFYNLDMNRPKKTYDLFGVRGAFLVNF